MNYAIAKIKSPDRTDSLATAILGFKCPAIRAEFFQYAAEIESFEFVSCRRAKETAKMMRLTIQFITKLPDRKKGLR